MLDGEPGSAKELEPASTLTTRSQSLGSGARRTKRAAALAPKMRLLLALASIQASHATINLRIQTAIQSRYLDKKLDLAIEEEDATILDVKRAAAKRFPGAPPASAQRLFLGSRLLADDEPLADVFAARK